MAQEDLAVEDQAFVQALIAKPTVSLRDAKQLGQKLAGARTDAEFNDLWSRVNSRLTTFDLEVRQVTPPGSSVRHVAVANRLKDDASGAATRMDGSKLAFFRAVLGELCSCAENVRDGVPRNEVSNANLDQEVETQEAVQAVVGMRMNQREEVIKELLQDGWLTQNEEGNVFIGARSVLELREEIDALASDEARQQLRL